MHRFSTSHADDYAHKSLNVTFGMTLRAMLRDVAPRPLAEAVRTLRHALEPGAQKTFPCIESSNFGDKIAAFEIHSRMQLFHSSELGKETNFKNRFVQAINQNSNNTIAVVGAAEGYYAIGAAVHGKAVTAFEPNRRSIAQFDRNVLLNADNISVPILLMDVAVTDCSGTAEFFNDPTDRKAGSLFRRDSSFAHQKVEVHRIDTLITSGRMASPKVVLIDVEGTELRVLRGMQDLLRSDARPEHIFIEIHPFELRAQKTDTQTIHKLLAENGYKIVWGERRNTEILAHYVANTKKANSCAGRQVSQTVQA